MSLELGDANLRVIDMTEMVAGVLAPLAEGDKLVLGAFTIARMNVIR